MKRNGSLIDNDLLRYNLSEVHELSEEYEKHPIDIDEP